MATATSTATKFKPAGRMTLASVVKGLIEAPVRVLLYGVEGIGKSTFAAGAPKPIFLGAEDGTKRLDVHRFPQPSTWQDVLEALDVLRDEKHDYETFVVDTLDWLEPLLWQYICDRDGKAGIEAYGYAKGYVAALDEWRLFLARIEALGRARPMHVVFLAHSWIKPFKNPEGDDFDRYELKLHAKAGGLLKEWSDCVLFTNYETFAKEDERTGRAKGFDTGVRFIYTQRRAAYDAKNRYDLPDRLPLDWSDFFAALQKHEPADPDKLCAAIEEKLEELDGDQRKKAEAAFEKAKGNAAQLAKVNDKLNATLAGKE